jgi:deazaflavin-dependent oxidoreductase (nitroreductase family)
MGGLDLLLLTTVGRKSGKRRTAPLLYRRDGDKVVLIASKGGAPEHPLWYNNLKANPDVEVQIRGDTLALRARDATAEERPRLWAMMAEKWKDYDNYQKKTSREIPVVVLEPRPS